MFVLSEFQIFTFALAILMTSCKSQSLLIRVVDKNNSNYSIYMILILVIVISLYIYNVIIIKAIETKER